LESGHGFEREEALRIAMIQANSTIGSRGWLRWPRWHALERGGAAYVGVVKQGFYVPKHKGKTGRGTRLTIKRGSSEEKA
jgi:hypothetical protein